MGARLLEYLNSTVWGGKCQVQSLNHIIQDNSNNSPIVPMVKEFKPIAPIGTIETIGTIGESKTGCNNAAEVDFLLKECSDLIVGSYKAWFAQRFYKIPHDRITTLASQARQDAKISRQRLFSYLINKEFNDGI